MESKCFLTNLHYFSQLNSVSVRDFSKLVSVSRLNNKFYIVFSSYGEHLSTRLLSDL